jgi:hypothetical protein
MTTTLLNKGWYVLHDGKYKGTREGKPFGSLSTARHAEYGLDGAQIVEVAIVLRSDYDALTADRIVVDRVEYERLNKELDVLRAPQADKAPFKMRGGGTWTLPYEAPVQAPGLNWWDYTAPQFNITCDDTKTNP